MIREAFAQRSFLTRPASLSGLPGFVTQTMCLTLRKWAWRFGNERALYRPTHTYPAGTAAKPVHTYASVGARHGVVRGALGHATCLEHQAGVGGPAEPSG